MWNMSLEHVATSTLSIFDVLCNIHGACMLYKSQWGDGPVYILQHFRPTETALFLFQNRNKHEGPKQPRPIEYEIYHQYKGHNGIETYQPTYNSMPLCYFCNRDIIIYNIQY